MAKIPFTGIPIPKNMIPGYTIYLTKKGYWQVRKIADMSERIKTDPAFEPLRQQSARFSQATKTGKLIRQAFSCQLKNLDKSELPCRLNKILMMANKSEEGLSLLNGFEFNKSCKLSNQMRASFEIAEGVDSVAVRIRAFIPHHYLKVPDKATHFRFIVANAMPDTQQQAVEVDGQETEWMTIENKLPSDIELVCKTAQREGLINILALGIEWRKLQNGRMDDVVAGRRTSFAIIKAWTGISSPTKNLSL